MTMKQTQQLIEGACSKAAESGINISVAVIDTDGLLSGFLRMDGALKGSVDVAVAKARTAFLFPMPTKDFGDLCRNEKLDGMLETNGGMVGFAGGFPVPGGGAIGISGGSAAQDAEVAQAAIATLMLES